MDDESILCALIFVPIILFLVIVNAAGISPINNGADLFAVIFAAIISAVVGIYGTGTLLSKFT